MAAQWIIDGRMQYDMFPWDMARFGAGPTRSDLPRRGCATNTPTGSRSISPTRNAPQGAPVRTRPIYERKKRWGRCWAELRLGTPACGLRTRRHARHQTDLRARTGGGLWAKNARCCANRRASSTSRTFAKYSCKGAGAADWLNAVFANTMPKAVGRSCLTPLIGKRGGIAGDFTVTKLADDEFWIIGSGMAERYHKRFFNEVPLPEGTYLRADRRHVRLQRGRATKPRRCCNADKCLAGDARISLHALQQIELAGRQSAGACGCRSRAIWAGNCIARRRSGALYEALDGGGQSVSAQALWERAR